MKLDGNNIIDYSNIPTSKPKSVSLNGIIYDARNPFWELEENDETSKLVNAIEIAWNGAEVTGADSTNLAQDDPVTINTTSELLTWIQQMVSKERFFALLQQYIGSNSLDIQVQGGKLYIDTNIPVEPPVITLTPSDAQVITGATIVSSTVSNGTSDNTTWSITNAGTSGQTFKLSSTTGSSVTITPNDTTAPTADKGYVGISYGSVTNNAITLTGTFAEGGVAVKTYETTVTASYTGANSKSIKLIFRKHTNPLSVGTYTWSVVSGKSLPIGITMSSNGATCTLTNTTNSSITIPAGTIQVVNSNGNRAVTNNAITLTVANKYYWYIGQTKPTNLSGDPMVTDVSDYSSIPNNTWMDKYRDEKANILTLSISTSKMNGRAVGGDSTKPWYVAVPSDLGLKPTASDYTTQDTAVSYQGTIMVNGKEYKYYLYGTGARKTICYAKV